jgi:hypothetical protein
MWLKDSKSGPVAKQSKHQEMDKQKYYGGIGAMSLVLASTLSLSHGWLARLLFQCLGQSTHIALLGNDGNFFSHTHPHVSPLFLSLGI